MIELIAFLSITLFCLVQDDEQRIVSLFLLLLPFHTLLKNSLEYFFEGGELFSAWKEVVILILAVKVFGKPHLMLNRLVFILLLFFFILVLVYFYISEAHLDALPALRDHLFPPILFFTAMAVKLELKLIKKMVILLAISIFISDLVGFAQYFFFNVPVAKIMGTAAYIDPSGYIHYKISSYRIMGMERMAGITGSPNIFGLFNAFAIILLFGVLLFKKWFQFSARQLQFVRITLALSVVSIIFSFSRAGWVIALLGTGLMLLYRDFHVRVKYALSSFLLLLVLLVLVAVVYPGAADIIEGSLTGREASAAARGSSVMKGINMLLDEPWGHGLGTTDNRKESVRFFVESAWMNIGYEIGILGVLYLISLHLVILYYLLDKAGQSALSRIAVAISFSTLVACLVSVNPFGMPYIYLWWFILGLGMNRSWPEVSMAYAAKI